MSENAIRVLIVDDTPDARENIRILLDKYEFVEIVGEAQHADEAKEQLFKHRPDLLFLDIKMPEKYGFDLLDELQYLPEIRFDVVFVTAYSNYAEEAFNYYPFNFLRKPVDAERLDTVIKKYRQKKMADYSQIKKVLEEQRKKLYFKQDDAYIWIDQDEILWCQASGNYTKIFLADGNLENVGLQLWKINNQLPEDQFFRTHRSYVVSLKSIMKIKRNGKISIRNNPFNEEPMVSLKKILLLVNKLNQQTGYNAT